uniref:Ubiquitin carboxyl-terminal hydrolase 47 C-terminal domain-containing protein n=1 Tax=Amphimedon queenslandica TaxID=400682 RepID=A0A1X7VE91_AMPQE
MESVVAVDTRVREFKKQIIEEAKVQGIDCVLELDKMRLRKKNGVSLVQYILMISGLMLVGKYLHATHIKMPDKFWSRPEKKYDGQIQVYVIRWHPSQCSVDPIEGIIDTCSSKNVIKKVSEFSGIPMEYIYHTEGMLFPVEISCLDIEKS